MRSETCQIELNSIIVRHRKQKRACIFAALFKMLVTIETNFDGVRALAPRITENPQSVSFKILNFYYRLKSYKFSFYVFCM